MARHRNDVAASAEAAPGQDVPGNAEINGDKPDSQPDDNLPDSGEGIGANDSPNPPPSGNPPDPGEGIEGSDSPNPPLAETAVVTNENRKGKTIVAVTGQPITFDDEGKATVSMEDALYLKQCPGYRVG